MIKYVKGDLIKMAQADKFDIIMHGCNCHRTMGAGIAKTIKDVFPVAFAADLAYGTGQANLSRLGEYSVGTVVQEHGPLDIVNLYTQYDMGPNAEYSALRQTLQLYVGEHFLTDERIGIPWIGCGIGSLSKDLVLDIITQEIGHLDITIVEFDS